MNGKKGELDAILEAINMWVLVALSLIIVAGCEGTSSQTNPYKNPRAQWEYDQWVSTWTKQRMRSDAILRPDQQTPVFQEYMRKANQTNSRLQQLRKSEKTTERQDFEAWMKLSKKTLAKTRRTAAPQKTYALPVPAKIRADPIRLKRFLKSQQEPPK